jgi:hypothetical protein
MKSKLNFLSFSEQGATAEIGEPAWRLLVSAICGHFTCPQGPDKVSTLGFLGNRGKN